MNYINDIPILLIMITLAIYIPLRLIYIKRRTNSKTKLSREIILLLVIAYAESLLYLTIFPTNTVLVHDVRVNIIPFQTINLYLNYHDNMTLQIINLVGNVVVFIPIGIFAGLLLEKITLIKVFLIGLCSTMFIEFMQLFLSINGVISRSFDVDDLILNTFGVLIGYYLGLLMMTLFKTWKNTFKF